MILGNSTGDALVALIQPHAAGITTMSRLALIDAVLNLNASLPVEKRLRRENIHIVSDLPLTTKFTINRKKVKKIFSEMRSDSDIPTFFPPPPPLVPFPTGHDDATTPFISSIRSSGDPDLRRRVAELLARIFSVHQSHFDGPDASLVDIPLTSLSSVRLAKALQDEFSVGMTSAQLYGIHNIDDLCVVLSSQRVGLATYTPSEPSGTWPDVPVAGVRPPQPDEGIAITGAACRFVGGINSTDSLWSALLSPDTFLANLSRQRPSSRWEQPHANEDMMLPSGWLDSAAIDNVSSVAEFFGISPHSARAMSPNARLVLQLGYEAIEDAGIAPRTLTGKNWGVFTSVNDSGWRERRVNASDLQGEFPLHVRRWVYAELYQTTLRGCKDQLMMQWVLGCLIFLISRDRRWRSRQHARVVLLLFIKVHTHRNFSYPLLTIALTH